MKNEQLYTVNIGTVFSLDQNKIIPSQSFQITESQLDILLRFADVRKDENLNSIYKLNECEFTVSPIILSTKNTTAFPQIKCSKCGRIHHINYKCNIPFENTSSPDQAL